MAAKVPQKPKQPVKKASKTVFVLENVPKSCSEAEVKDFLHETVEVPVLDVKLYSFIPGRALVTFKTEIEDFQAAENVLKKSRLGSQKVKLLQSRKELAIVVDDFDPSKLSEDFLKLYLTSTFADGKEVTESSESWPHLRLCIVYFPRGQRKDPADQRTPLGTELYMFLTRTLLGNVFSLDENHATCQTRDPNQKLSRAPCMKCKLDKCTCHPQPLYNSVMADGKWIFREFVVYRGHESYPEYLIKYVRTKPT